MVKQTKTVYSSDSIVNETPREFTRRVPSTYLGSSITNENLIKEIYANAVDEAKIGHGDLIRVSIDTIKNVYCVEDFGQGFLINEPGVDKKTGKKIDDGETILQRSFDKINTSGKTSVDGVYGGNSLGLNGIGAKLTNWLSSTLHVITYRDGRFEELWFKDGIFVKRKVGKSDRHSGTIVTWSPDPQFFKQNIPNMSMIDALLDHTTTFCSGLTVELEYNGSKKTFKEPDGLNGYLARKVGEKEVFSQRFITDRSISVNDYAYEYDGQTIFLLDSDFNSKGICEKEFTLYEETPQGGQIQHKETLTIAKSDCVIKEREENINIGITFTRDHSETIDAYVNLGHTESGAHITAFHGAIARAINKYAVEAGLLKKSDKSLSSSEVCDGLYVVFNITTTTAKYDAQNKSHIDDIDTTIINSVLSGDFATWLLNNKADAKAIVENALIERKARENAQKARDKTREVANGKGAKSIFADLPTKLSDAYPRNKKDRSNCELYICLKGDTKVKLLDGTSPTIESLVGKQDIWAYSTDETGTMIPAKIKKVFKTQETSKLIKLTFNDGSVVECTPEHKFLDRDTCQWVEAKDLVVGQSMFSMKFKVGDSINLKDRPMVWIPMKYTKYNSKTKKIQGHWEPVHKRVAKLLGISKDVDGVAMDIHHKDLNKNNNDPSNLVYITKKEHMAIHNKLNYESGIMDFEKKHFSEESLSRMQKGVYMRTQEGIEKQRKAVQDGWKSGKYANATWRNYNTNTRFKNGFDQTQLNKVCKLVREMLDQNLTVNAETYTEYGKTHRKMFVSFEKALTWFGSAENLIENGKNYNLKVTSIEYVTYEQPIPVYCLDIDNPFHSFVLDNGIITHNCEGDSAGSSIKGVKNSEFQAVMPIRGKILNCLKEKDIAKIYGNAEVAGIVKALGLDVNPKTHRLIFNEAKLRYSKIIIATDADADGSDISSLLLTVFDFLCPELIEKGYIYRVYGALFKAVFNDNTYVLLQNDADLEAWKKKNKKPYTLTRAKGLGELTAEETEEQLVNPMTRNLKRLKVDNYDEFKKYLLIYKGDAKEDKEARKEYYNKLVGGND